MDICGESAEWYTSAEQKGTEKNGKDKIQIEYMWRGDHRFR